MSVVRQLFIAPTTLRLFFRFFGGLNERYSDLATVGWIGYIRLITYKRLLHRYH